MHIRNFSIIAHIDHGKTTLTDRLLELTGTIAPQQAQDRLMDSNPIEKERGITIKLAPVRLLYRDHILNLIDTPGHVDFAYEVSRSLSACEGAVLVVDATKGIQAQTIANYDKAKEHGLVIIPVLNKIDMDSAEPDRVANELVEVFGYRHDEILRVSAKTGSGVTALLDAIVDRIPAPAVFPSSDLRALIFNSLFDTHKGVIAFVKVIEGEISPGNLDRLFLHATKEMLHPQEIGYFSPSMKVVDRLTAGEVGYIATGHKDIKDITIGDTVTTVGTDIIPVPGYERPQPMVYMDMYPLEADDYKNLADSLGKLALNDSSLMYRPISSPALGSGFRVGFLGILHAEIVSERLRREFEVNVINTSPSVPYRLELKNGSTPEISSPSEWPNPETIAAVEEPYVTLTIYTPDQYVGNIMELCQNRRTQFVDMQYLGGRVRLHYLMPLIELITNFYDTLKSVSSGYASAQYEHAGYEPVDAVKVDILLNGSPAEALSFISPRLQADAKGRKFAVKLKEVIKRSQIEVAIQAAIGGKIIARETIKAFRKDVEAKLHGGDMSRNRKLLEKQKKGKKKMKMIGSVNVPQEAFTEILKI